MNFYECSAPPEKMCIYIYIRVSGWSPPPWGFTLGFSLNGPHPTGGTQDTDFKKGITKGFFSTNLRRRNAGVRGTQTP